MKIVICGSMSFAKEILVIRDRLVQAGHKIIVPRDAEIYAREPSKLETKWETSGHDPMRRYYKEIGESDAILVVNMSKNSVANYIGGNTFLEMGFAHVLDKTVYLLNPIPDMAYRDEMITMQPVVLSGNLSLLYEKK